ncbi:DM13 domain-containing protein [Flavobacterium amniphilum]|uniref:DM13 domain-containing protein n=1 Tax=Flavobacterium amniphilum TaxID=1834035 RepID=UPI002029DB09|nr:DM13 domain-containing protein [Flavobacterium amniphilum]MCL9804407.1 DM13 domain-containing protein [Flavobacterium amniphilum]
MKKILFLVMAAFSLFSCEADGDLSLGNPVLVSGGEFEPTSGITVTGSAKIYSENNQRKVVLDNFSISEGPDLKVYLSTSSAPTTFINLGDLTTATEYSIPKNLDLDAYPYVLIHCQQYNHLFAVSKQE